MDFPFYHLAFFGDRSLIAVIGAVHVIINHMLAVGGIPLVVALEWWGWKTHDPQWDILARRIMFVFFILATTVGALTGVGMWLSISLINPEALGSLLRVFFWVWFSEWIVFVSEVVLIVCYYLSWEKLSGERKASHITLGLTLCAFSWITMTLIVAILGFMMNPGTWLTDHKLLSAIFNDIYIPQLAFRTPMAMVMAGCAGMGLVACFTVAGSSMRVRGLRFTAIWTLAWAPLCLIALAWYYSVVPKEMLTNLPYALGTAAYQADYHVLLGILVGLMCVVAIYALLALLVPGKVPSAAWVVPVLCVMVLAGVFERSREFLRKPYVIYQYMYANRFRPNDYKLLNHEGLLPNSTFASITAVTPDNQVEAGSEIFQIACATCHTVGGVNSIRDKFANRLGKTQWRVNDVEFMVDHLHTVLAFMPPFPGSTVEEHALAMYLVTLQRDIQPLPPELSPAAGSPATKSH